MVSDFRITASPVPVMDFQEVKDTPELYWIYNGVRTDFGGHPPELGIDLSFSWCGHERIARLAFGPEFTNRLVGEVYRANVKLDILDFIPLPQSAPRICAMMAVGSRKINRSKAALAFHRPSISRPNSVAACGPERL